MTATTCTNCGATLTPGAKFCPNCAHPVAATAAAPVQPEATTAAPAADTTASTAVAEPASTAIGAVPPPVGAVPPPVGATSVPPPLPPATSSGVVLPPAVTRNSKTIAGIAAAVVVVGGFAAWQVFGKDKAPQAGPFQPQPGVPQPGVPQPGVPQPGVPQPGVPQPGNPNPAGQQLAQLVPQTVGNFTLTGTQPSPDMVSLGAGEGLDAGYQAADGRAVGLSVGIFSSPQGAEQCRQTVATSLQQNQGFQLIGEQPVSTQDGQQVGTLAQLQTTTEEVIAWTNNDICAAVRGPIGGAVGELFIALPF